MTDQKAENPSSSKPLEPEDLICEDLNNVFAISETMTFPELFERLRILAEKFPDTEIETHSICYRRGDDYFNTVGVNFDYPFVWRKNETS